MRHDNLLRKTKTIGTLEEWLESPCQPWFILAMAFATARTANGPGTRDWDQPDPYASGSADTAAAQQAGI